MEASRHPRSALAPWIGPAIFVAVGVGLDQVTKLLATTHLQGRPFRELIGGYFELRYSLNRGAFFSFGADFPPGFRQVFFVVMSLVAIGLIVRLYRQLEPQQRSLRWALVSLLTGAVGNLIDRIARGEVVDFLHLHLRDVFHWATFNVADIYIAIGLCLLIVDMLRPQNVTRRATGEPQPSPHPQ